MHKEGKIIAEKEWHGRERRLKYFPQEQDGQRWGWFWKLSVGILILCVFIWSWSKLTNPETLPIHSIKINGNFSSVNHELLQQTIAPFIQKGFFGVDRVGLQDRMQQLPWVHSVSVRRIWPDTLAIQIEQQQPVARLAANTLVNAQGEIFTVESASIPQNLPQFEGPVGQQQLMLQMYHAIMNISQPLGVKIAILRLDDYQAWQLQLDNGIEVIVGAEDPLYRIQRLFHNYKEIIGTRVNDIQSIDLRYLHGAALTFRKQNLATSISA